MDISKIINTLNDIMIRNGGFYFFLWLMHFFFMLSYKSFTSKSFFTNVTFLILDILMGVFSVPIIARPIFESSLTILTTNMSYGEMNAVKMSFQIMLAT